METAAFSSAELVNFENIANDCAVLARTVREYFTILEDTLIARLIEPFRQGRKRKPVSSGKLYFFDVGISNTLQGRRITKPGTAAYGKALEKYVFTEILAYLSYRKDERKLSFWRTREGLEVDFLIGQDTAVEVKASENISEKHCKPFRYLSEEAPINSKMIVSLVPRPRVIGDISVLPVADFLKNLWNDRY